MYARVRSPGWREAVTPSAAVRRTSASGESSRESATSSATGASSSGRSTSSAETCSENSRDQALAPVTPFSVRIFSSGSLSRWGR